MTPAPTTGRRSRWTALAPLALLACAGCGEQASVPPAPGSPRQQPPALEHDFGVIPHGETRVHDYVLDTSDIPDRLVPLRVHLDCSCGRGQPILRAADGLERTVDGRPFSENAQRPGETLIARVFVDTITKDPVDLPHGTSRATVVLQPVDDATGLRRVHWPLLVRFGIDCPVEVEPFAAIDFGKVPQSTMPVLTLTLRGDENHRDVKFGAVQASDPALEAELLQQGDHVLLQVRCRPGEVRSYRGVVRVDTDLPNDYAVNLSATWKVIPDLEAYPLDMLSFSAPLDRAQSPADASSQYLQIANHKPGASAEFTVREIVGDDGRDASSAFEVRFEPITGRNGHRRMYVRYLGGLRQQFRGRIVLQPVGDEGARLPIPLVVFPLRR